MNTHQNKTAVIAQRINAQDFAAYGDILENKSTQRRRDFPLPFAEGDVKLAQQLWVNRLPRQEGTSVMVDAMENHPYSAQTFVPMRPGRCLVVVALPGADGKPALTTLRAFVTEGGQGITYRPSVWHYTFTSLDEPNEVVVVMGYSGPGGHNDTVIEHFAEHVDVTFEGKGDRDHA